jgi:hypothetical protein
MKRRSPLAPDSSRTFIVLFLTFSPWQMLRSDFLAQFGHVFLLFILKLVLFSSNFFNFDANFFGNQPFLVFRYNFLVYGNSPPGNWHFLPIGNKASRYWDYRSANCTFFYKKCSSLRLLQSPYRFLWFQLQFH